MQSNRIYFTLSNNQNCKQEAYLRHIFFFYDTGNNEAYWIIEYIENEKKQKYKITNINLHDYINKKKITLPNSMDGTLHITTPQNQQYLHIGDTYYQQDTNQTWLSITQKPNNKYQYDIHDIWTKTPTALATWFNQYIPIEQFTAHYAPYGEDHNSALFYHEKISRNIPCTMIGLSWPNIENEEGVIDYALQPVDKDHPLILTLYQMCYIDSNKEPDYSKKLNHLTTNSEHDIPSLMHYLEHVFLQQENISTLSQHQRTQLYRTIIKHGKDIAQDIYNQIMEHYQHRAHPPTLTFSPLTPKSKDSPPCSAT